MSRNLIMVLSGAVCAAALVVPAAGAASAGERPEIGPCKSKVHKVEAKPKNKAKTSAERKAVKKAKKRGNDQAFTGGLTVICR